MPRIYTVKFKGGERIEKHYDNLRPIRRMVSRKLCLIDKVIVYLSEPYSIYICFDKIGNEFAICQFLDPQVMIDTLYRWRNLKGVRCQVNRTSFTDPVAEVHIATIPEVMI